jgi:O-antigen ligase
VGIWQYVANYLGLARMSSAFPPIWSYTVGSCDPFMWHDCVGLTICVMLPVVYGLLHTSRSAGERRYLRLIGLLLCLTFVLTFARGAWLAFLVVLGVGAVWVGGRRRWWVPALIVGVAAAAAAAHTLGLVRLDQLMGREGTTAERVLTARVAWDVVREHPLLGISPLEWNIRWVMGSGLPFYYKGGAIAGWLQVPIEGGVVGCVLLLILIAALARKVGRALTHLGDASSVLLVKCTALGLIAVGVANSFDCVLLEEGRIIAPILLGVVLGVGRHQWSQMRDTDADRPA